MTQLMKQEDAGIKRSMLHAMTVLFKRQPNLFSSTFTANDGEAYHPPKNVSYHCAMPSCLCLLHLVRGSLSYMLMCFCWAGWTLMKSLLRYWPPCRLFLGSGLHLGRGREHQSCSPACRSSDH